MSCRAALLIFGLVLASNAQGPPPAPDVEAQRAAMKKLEFLVGKWTGEASVRRGPGEPLALIQTEDVQYKLDGLLMLVEGTGKNKSDGKVVFRALGIISYDDMAGAYKMQAYTDGRQTPAHLTLDESGKGFRWGFEMGGGQIKTSYVMKINEKGEWVETGEFIFGSQPPRKFLEMTVRPVK